MTDDWLIGDNYGTGHEMTHGCFEAASFHWSLLIRALMFAAGNSRCLVCVSWNCQYIVKFFVSWLNLVRGFC